MKKKVEHDNEMRAKLPSHFIYTVQEREFMNKLFSYLPEKMIGAQSERKKRKYAGK